MFPGYYSKGIYHPDAVYLLAQILYDARTYTSRRVGLRR